MRKVKIYLWILTYFPYKVKVKKIKKTNDAQS